MSAIPNNGTVEVWSAVGGGCDADGNPIAVGGSYGLPVGCRIIREVQRDEREEGHSGYVVSSYVVYCDGVGEWSADRVRLVRGGVVLGEFNVQSIMYLPLVGRVKIVV